MRTSLLLLFIALFSSTSCVEFPIEIVYLWVDGSDPDWQEQRNFYAPTFREGSTDANTNNRFSDHDELKYSLRSIWKFAPFVKQLYIVTMNQKPKWLKSHPMIKIIDHREIFQDPSNLPTFNSQAIECNLHRIPNLSEHFIYFNDDVFLGLPIQPSDFFSSDGKVKVLLETSLSPSGPRLENETSYRTAWRNTNDLLDSQYRKERRYRMCHAPFALRKSLIAEAEIAFPHVFLLNSSHRFRSFEDYNVTNGFLQYLWFYQNKAIIGSITNRMVTLRGDKVYEKTKTAIDTLLTNRPHTFCLEDNMPENNKATTALLHQFLEEYFPDPAPWEITNSD